jgi:large subunit ribosomal protein L2
MKLNLKKKKSFVALIKYINGSISYINAPFCLFPGNIVQTITPVRLFNNINIFNLGNKIFLYELKINMLFINIIVNNVKINIANASGTFCKLLYHKIEKNLTYVKIPSGLKIFFKSNSLVTLGRNSNVFSNKILIGKAGLNRLKGIRPTVRGVAMNPVDHPHGGRTKTNKPEVTP